MNINLFKIKCITNLHVGSGEANFSIIDNEVEKDPVTGLPVIHASGIKGALRDAAKDAGFAEINKVFGSPEKKDSTGNGGTYKFFDARFLARPLRISGNSRLSYIMVTSLTAINDFIDFAEDFGIDIGIRGRINIDFGGKSFLSTVKGIKIEGKDAGSFAESDREAVEFIKGLIGDFALCSSIDDFPLPVNSRNCLDENGISRNLWFEEYVPHHSVMWIAVLYPDADFALDFLDRDIIQIGGNASIGNGFVKFEKI